MSHNHYCVLRVRVRVYNSHVRGCSRVVTNQSVGTLRHSPEIVAIRSVISNVRSITHENRFEAITVNSEPSIERGTIWLMTLCISIEVILGRLG